MSKSSAAHGVSLSCLLPGAISPSREVSTAVTGAFVHSFVHPSIMSPPYDQQHTVQSSFLTEHSKRTLDMCCNVVAGLRLLCLGTGPMSRNSTDVTNVAYIHKNHSISLLLCCRSHMDACILSGRVKEAITSKSLGRIKIKHLGVHDMLRCS